RNPRLVFVIAGVATPFLFYGLEFWEHTPAVALATIGTAMFVSASGARQSRLPFAFAAGLAFGAAFLLRPESAVAFFAVLAASAILPRNRDAKVRLKPDATYILAMVGAAVVITPLEIYTFRHFGRLMPAHIWANAGLLQTSWVAQRAHLMAAWFLP